MAKSAVLPRLPIRRPASPDPGPGQKTVARDFGYDSQPFIWNEEERHHLRARLDALYFHLYGLSRKDAAYILDTFPIVRRHDKAAFGHYRTKDMVLAYYNALNAGDTSTDVAV